MYQNAIVTTDVILYSYHQVMKRINISLPDDIKAQGDKLVHLGEFSTFSELVRVGLRLIFENYEAIESLKGQVRHWKKINRTREVPEFSRKNT